MISYTIVNDWWEIWGLKINILGLGVFYQSLAKD